MKADAEIRAEVFAVFKGLWKAYQEKDLAGVLSFYVPDPDLLILGTGADERYAGMRAVTRGLKRDFSQSQGVRIKMTKLSVLFFTYLYLSRCLSPCRHFSLAPR
ncbi:MAG: nuclear transport factor 2 family protein [Pseudomonadota bacterium]